MSADLYFSSESPLVFRAPLLSLEQIVNGMSTKQNVKKKIVDQTMPFKLFSELTEGKVTLRNF